MNIEHLKATVTALFGTPPWMHLKRAIDAERDPVKRSAMVKTIKRLISTSLERAEK